MTDTNDNTKPAKRRRRMAREPQDAIPQQMAAAPPSSESAPPLAKPPSKANLVLQLLRRPDGATIAQLVDATGWLPHTTRAALTGLKKKGHKVTSSKTEGEERIYRVGVA